MSIDNPGNFFVPGDMEGHEDSESWKPVKLAGSELYKKSIDILNVTQTICDLMPDEEYEEMTKALMLENAMIVSSKVRSSMTIDHVYSLVMENAVIIKVNICELKAQLWACDEIHGIEQKYIAVLREEIESFREIFIKWVAAFDKTKDYPDKWHLFNNPGDFPADEQSGDE